MEKIKVFIGPPASGKSRKARELAEGRNVFWKFPKSDNSVFTPFMLYGLDKDTEIIIIEEIQSKKKLETLIYEFFNDKLVINIPRRTFFEIPRPEIILICDFDSYIPKEESIKRRIEITDFGKPENQYTDNIKSEAQIEMDNRKKYIDYFTANDTKK